MRIFAEKYRLLVWLGILLGAGFLATSLTAYVVSRDSVRRDIAEQALPLTGDTIYAEIQSDFLRPTCVASMMANDSFVRDWLRGGEADPQQIVRYLARIKQEYGTLTSFLASDSSRKSYYADGTLKVLDDSDPHDRWFQREKEASTPFVIDIDADHASRNALTVFINYRIVDDNGAFLGVAGVGLRFDALSTRIDRYQRRFGRRIYFVDAHGAIMLTGSMEKPAESSILTMRGMRAIAPMLLREKNKPVQLAYERDSEKVFVNARFVPELGWYLVVEQNAADEVRPARNVLVVNLAISAGVTLLILALTLLAVNRYQQRLEQMAGTDMLTGLLNRQAFEIVFRQSALDAERTGRPLSVILFDIDFFKQVNDTHGHLAGDEVLRTVARLAQETLRESDAVTRWGGEEFVILLKECPLEQAVGIAEKLREAIDRHDFSAIMPDRHITVSLGVAQYDMQEAVMSFFARVDTALYKAKANGRNRLQVALPKASDTAA